MLEHLCSRYGRGRDKETAVQGADKGLASAHYLTGPTLVWMTIVTVAQASQCCDAGDSSSARHVACTVAQERQSEC
jgi:hypothetical protein